MNTAAAASAATLLLLFSAILPASGFGVTFPHRALGRARSVAVHRCPPLRASMDVEDEKSKLEGDRLLRAVQYQKVFNEKGMGADMRKFNVQKVREGNQPLLLESRLSKASRYAALFETEGQRGIERVLRVKVNLAKEDIELKAQEARAANTKSSKQLRKGRSSDSMPSDSD